MKSFLIFVRSVKGRGDQARLFTSILVHLEEQNNAMMFKLQGTNEERSCAVMQGHLERLKTLVDKVFVEEASVGPAADLVQSLNAPSMVESTPLHVRPTPNPLVKKQKLMSRIQLNKNFSPVVLKQPITSQDTFQR